MGHAITWSIEKRKLSELIEWADNPRLLTEKGMKDLKRSIQKFGCAEPLVVNTDGTICGGHGRKKVLESLAIDEVDCYIPSRQLTKPEFEELGIRLNRNIAGGWDFEKLANLFNVGELIDWGFNEKEMGIFDVPEDNKAIDEEGMKDTENECPKCGFKW